MKMSHHVVEPKTYYQIFAALMVLLLLTIVAARIDNPVVNVTSAITIAVTKAVLIVLYFMHVKYSSKLTQVISVAGVVWLGILLVLLASDYQTRSWPMVTGSALETVDSVPHD